MTDAEKHDPMLPNGASNSEQSGMPSKRSLSLDCGLQISQDLPVHGNGFDPASASGSKTKLKSRSSIGRTWKVGTKGKKTSKSFSTSGSPKKARVAALSRAVHSQPSLELYKTREDGCQALVSTSNVDVRRDDGGSLPEICSASSNVDMKIDKKEKVKKKKIKVKRRSSKPSVVNEDKIWHTLDTTSADVRRSAFRKTKVKRPVTLPPTFDIFVDPSSSTEYTHSQGRVCTDPDPECLTRDRLVCSDTSLNTRHRVTRRVSSDTSKHTDTTNSFDSEVRAVTGLPRHQSSLGLYLEVDRQSAEGREGTDTSGHARTAPPSPETDRHVHPSQPDSLGLLQVPATLTRRRSTDVLSHSKEYETFPGEARKTPVKISPKNHKRNEKFHKIFKNIPESETVIKSYLCAFVGDILLQGYIYISPNFFCFYTKILGHEKQLEIPVADVVNITREKTALIIPNGIGIVTCKDKFVFGSLMNRDNSYRLMVNVWKKMNPGDDVYDTASDTEHINTDFQQPEGDDSSISSNPSDSICSECGTPMTEHEPGLACDNSPTSCDFIFDDEPLAIKGTSRKANAPKGPVASGVGSVPREDCANNARHVTKTVRAKRNIPESNFDQRQKPEIIDRYSRWMPLSLSFPKTNTLLLLYLAILVLLVISALMMASKILFLQSQFEKNVGGQTPTSHRYTHTSQQMYKEICDTYERLQLPGLDKFQSALESNIDLLNKIQASLLNLQSSAVQTGPCSAAPDDS